MCKTTINLVPENGEVLNVLEGDDAETNALRAKRRCQKCGTAMDSYLIDPSVSCTSVVITRPATATRLKRANSASRAMTARWWNARSAGLKCHLRMGRFGKYMATRTNDECKNTRKILRHEWRVAPPKEDPDCRCRGCRVRSLTPTLCCGDGAAGVFLAANTFPKSRETRAPLVEELYASAIVCRKNCVISPMRRSRIRKAIKRWYALAVKPSSSTWRPKKRAQSDRLVSFLYRR